MKKFAYAAVLIAGLTYAPAVFAGAGGSCHFHGNAPVKESILAGCATGYKDGLASSGKIDPSWKGIKMDQAETIEGKKMKEWRFTFRNPALADTSRQTLFLFYSLTGNFIGANYTGK
jgi:hypothetical protein